MNVLRVMITGTRRLLSERGKGSVTVYIQARWPTAAIDPKWCYGDLEGVPFAWEDIFPVVEIQ